MKYFNRHVVCYSSMLSAFSITVSEVELGWKHLLYLILTAALILGRGSSGSGFAGLNVGGCFNANEWLYELIEVGYSRYLC